MLSSIELFGPNLPMLLLKTEDWLAEPCRATLFPLEKICTSNICRGSAVVDWIFTFCATHANGDGCMVGGFVMAPVSIGLFVGEGRFVLLVG
jgi:hypothetical protein